MTPSPSAAADEVEVVAKALALATCMGAPNASAVRWPDDWSQGEQTEFRLQAVLAVKALDAARSRAGMVTVPREPTEAMVAAGHGYLYQSARLLYRAMIDAAVHREPRT